MESNTSIVVKPKDEHDVLCDLVLDMIFTAVWNYSCNYLDYDKETSEKYAKALEDGVVPKVWIKKKIIEALRGYGS